MYRIVKKEALKPTVILYEIEAPMVAKKAEPGQFIILRVDENGERIPITIHDYDREKGTVTVEGREFPMPDLNFPTVDPANPYELTEEETELIDKLIHSFKVSDKLQRHINTMLQHGSMYLVCNSNLLFHASVPLNADGSLKEVTINGKKYKGPELLDFTETIMRAPFSDSATQEFKDFARDYYWYLWCGADSSLFDKAKMATFERYFLTDTPRGERSLLQAARTGGDMRLHSRRLRCGG